MCMCSSFTSCQWADICGPHFTATCQSTLLLILLLSLYIYKPISLFRKTKSRSTSPWIFNFSHLIMNCNLELRLFPTSDEDHRHPQTESYSNDQEPPQQQQQKPQKLTIFYNGTVCVCDATELQAKAILMLASREMEDNKIRKFSSGPSSSSSSSGKPVSPIRTSPPPVYSSKNNTALSMKRSLQRFLQKRNNRMQATYPYNINRRPQACRLNLHWCIEGFTLIFFFQFAWNGHRVSLVFP